MTAGQIPQKLKVLLMEQKQQAGKFPGTSDEDMYTVDLRAEPPELNSILTTDVASGDILRMVISGLYRLDENRPAGRGFGRSTEVSEDGCTYTMKIRQE